MTRYPIPTLLTLFLTFVTGGYFIVRHTQKAPQAIQELQKDKQHPAHNNNSSQQEQLSRAETLRNRTPSPESNLEPRITSYTDGSIDLAEAVKVSAQLHQSTDPACDLELASQLLQHYRFIFKENPIGTENFEFTAALTGDNPKKVNFISPESPALTSNNELVDRWGSPLCFHPLSATEMEILSYGPDQTPWTKDDLTYTTNEENSVLKTTRIAN